jgi:methylglutaconyl-CoA hydratase
MQELITLQQTGLVATLTINRPELRNALNAEVIRQLTAACEALRQAAQAEGGPRVLVLQGAGAAFCAGADLAWMQASLEYSEAENRVDAARLDALLAALDTLPLAVVGRVQGAAIGGGVGLACCCDIVLAADDAVFGFSEVRLGLLPAMIGRYVLNRIGMGHTRALFVSGRRFNAQHALAIGLVHELVPAAELDAAVERTVADLLRCGPQAIAATKALLREVSALPAEAARNYAIDAIAAARAGAEGQEGLRAFLEKRAPGWQG